MLDEDNKKENVIRSHLMTQYKQFDMLSNCNTHI